MYLHRYIRIPLIYHVYLNKIFTLSIPINHHTHVYCCMGTLWRCLAYYKFMKVNNLFQVNFMKLNLHGTVLGISDRIHRVSLTFDHAFPNFRSMFPNFRFLIPRDAFLKWLHSSESTSSLCGNIRCYASGSSSTRVLQSAWFATEVRVPFNYVEKSFEKERFRILFPSLFHQLLHVTKDNDYFRRILRDAEFKRDLPENSRFWKKRIGKFNFSVLNWILDFIILCLKNGKLFGELLLKIRLSSHWNLQGC